MDDEQQTPEEAAFGRIMARQLTAPDKLAEEISKISKFMGEIFNSKLREDVLITLIANQAKAPKGVTRDVLMAARNLEKAMLKQPTSFAPKDMYRAPGTIHDRADLEE